MLKKNTNLIIYCLKKRFDTRACTAQLVCTVWITELLFQVSFVVFISNVRVNSGREHPPGKPRKFEKNCQMPGPFPTMMVKCSPPPPHPPVHQTYIQKY